MKLHETALITGASGGIGYEFAKVFAEKGVNLVIVARSEDKLNMLADELKNEHQIDVRVIAKDLSSAQSVHEVYDEIEEAGIQIDELCRQHNISRATYYSWRSKYGGRSLITPLFKFN